MRRNSAPCPSHSKMLPTMLIVHTVQHWPQFNIVWGEGAKFGTSVASLAYLVISLAYLVISLAYLVISLAYLVISLAYLVIILVDIW